ncbi:Hsp20/alpha crystallin family protein [Immundisolibacter sp.]|jgi:HSP20 family protein|uniref:Hsp20/alpha crystallin family protein n=1 Tax=Immundisolibacter sp. TaxID=1934948 RepID=UPI000ECB1A0B|nr:heat-shock protein Hsp20 [Gammaproteobacteria bacterium]
MNIVRQQPYGLLSELQREMDRLFSASPLREDATAALAGGDWQPAVDVREETDRYELYVDLPGVQPDAVDINLEQGVLTISGERTAIDAEEAQQFRRVERPRGRFVRRFSVPDSVDIDQVTARADNGVLKVSIPKLAKVMARRIPVNA